MANRKREKEPELQGERDVPKKDPKDRPPRALVKIDKELAARLDAVSPALTRAGKIRHVLDTLDAHKRLRTWADEAFRTLWTLSQPASNVTADQRELLGAICAKAPLAVQTINTTPKRMDML